MVESNPQNKKHQKLNKDKEGVTDVEIKTLVRKVKNKLDSPFISQQKDWENEEHFVIPKDILKGIIEGLEFKKPSKIQAIAIPMFLKKDDKDEYEDLIAQSKNGSGKTGAFTIGSLLRVDPNIKKPQVIVLGHTRELVNQIFEVFSLATKFSDITVKNCADATTPPKEHVIITTLGKLLSFLTGRAKIDLSELKLVVVDEADSFFDQQKSEEDVLKIWDELKKLKHRVQKVMISATYNEDVQDKIGNLIEEANQISLRVEQLQLDHIQQFEFRCEPKQKIQFLMDVFSYCQMTQTIIFINTLNFAEVVFRVLKQNGYKAAIIFSRMEREERDEMMEKFRNREINVVLTTNLLARGIDIPEIELVINFDVPKVSVKGVYKPDHENYLHRIGRAGRFGGKGIAVTLYDNEDDEKVLHQIAKHYQMEASLRKLDSPEQLKTLLTDLDQV
eukprot:403359974